MSASTHSTFGSESAGRPPRDSEDRVDLLNPRAANLITLVPTFPVAPTTVPSRPRVTRGLTTNEPATLPSNEYCATKENLRYA